MGAFAAAAPIIGKAALGTAASYGAGKGMEALFGGGSQNMVGGPTNDPMQDPHKIQQMHMIAALLQQMQMQQMAGGMGGQMGAGSGPMQPIQMES